MSQQDTRSSGPTEGPSTVERYDMLTRCRNFIENMLREKEQQYGRAGGFYECNPNGNYIHAMGEARLKIGQYTAKGDRRDLVKAITWLYLIFETEELRGPRKD